MSVVNVPPVLGKNFAQALRDLRDFPRHRCGVGKELLTNRRTAIAGFRTN